ncbi:hypothetical protein, partial [Stenotrophomonas maltophilia]|uniref:hypothetical protein n=1 Tax=Stenotrophomonas maltophilia TaxID=40324 RepID=UPI001C8C9807
VFRFVLLVGWGGGLCSLLLVDVELARLPLIFANSSRASSTSTKARQRQASKLDIYQGKATAVEQARHLPGQGNSSRASSTSTRARQRQSSKLDIYQGKATAVEQARPLPGQGNGSRASSTSTRARATDVEHARRY